MSNRGDPAYRQAWLMAARLIFKVGKRQPCFVCGKFQSITHAHHVIPLAAQYQRGFVLPDSEHEWLCPTHHAILHAMIPPEGETDPQKIGERVPSEIADADLEEIRKLLDLVARSGRRP